ncbi:hypothetical protein [Corynebacterium mayonis]|uniref:hypothetical protein n=1 Tax=Corynebacterium mayonis TaxID=3062461 RepID=UPI00314057DA
MSVALSLYLFLSATSAVESSYIGVAMTAWVLAGIVGIGVLSLYFVADAKARARGFYSTAGWQEFLYWGTLVALGAGVALSAIHIGLWFGKL